MRRVFIIAFLALSIGLTTAPVRAADQTVDISDSQAELIKQNCKQDQSVLQRLRTADVVTRVNRGRIYENLLNRLIAPLNSRVSLNHYDASDLIGATTAINQKFSDFKTDYQAYADSLTSLLSIDCEGHPRSFYEILVTTRTDREKLATDITDLNALFDRYNDAFRALQMKIGGAS